jgi:hypothetical protein
MIALVLGCAENVWADAASILSRCTPDAVFAVKDMIARWPLRIDYGVTLHPDRTDEYMRDRNRRNWPCNFSVWSHRRHTSMTVHKVTPDWAGSSGLFAVKIALEEGFDGVVLAGVPMEAEFGHVRRHQTWGAAKTFRNGWLHRVDQLKPHVRSMSGWTREIFGEPTPHWIELHGSTSPQDDWVAVLKQKFLPPEHELLNQNASRCDAN